jgi:Flp pilus assembly secretin CpaC
MLPPFAFAALAQQSSPLPPSAPQAAPTAKVAAAPGTQGKPASQRDRRRAAKLYLVAAKLFEKGEFEPAMHDYEAAATLDPATADYALAAQVARSHAVTALIQAAAKARTQGDDAAARASLQHASELDPTNPQLGEHLNELAGDALAGRTAPLYEDAGDQYAGVPRLEPNSSLPSFHVKMDRRQLIQKVYKAYGIDAVMDQSVGGFVARFDLDNVSFSEAIRALDMITGCFAVPLDPHRVVVAKDTRQNREQFQREEVETIYLPGFTAAEMTEVSNIAKNVFSAPQVSITEGKGTVTLRATPGTLDAFNATMQELIDGRSDAILDVRIIQLAHTSQRNTGAQLPTQFNAFNVFAEEQSILNANQALVQQIISSGLASANDPLAILAILIASGQVSSALFANGFATFGGGLALSAISPGPTALNLNVNSSDSRELDDVKLRLQDGQDETIRSGTRYPILQSSYSGLSSSAIKGLTAAGNSSSLAGLASGISGLTSQIPQVSYQDLGLTLKAVPRVMRNGDVALTLDMKITALAGSSNNGIPVLNNRSYSGVVTLKDGEGVVLMSELDRQESIALSGVPGITDIPGLNSISPNDKQLNTATLLIVLTPQLVRGPKFVGHSPMMRIARTTNAQ